MSEALPQAGGQFPSTHWSMVGEAGGADSPARRDALEALVRRYLGPLKVYLMRKRRLGPDEADELLQSFVGEKVLDGRFAAAADRSRGRFRSFLLTSLDHFLIDQLRKRRPSPAPADGEPAPDAAAPQAPDPFDVAWARQVINDALARMEAACRAGGRHDAWAIFERRVVGPTLLDRPAPPYEQLVADLGFASPTEASNCLVTAKRMFARHLREVVNEYAGGDADVEAELADLMAVLSGGRAR